MNIFSKLTAAFKSLPFSGYGGSGYGGGAAYVPGISLTGTGFPGAGLPGTNYDYKTAAGVLWQNPSAAACFVALTKAFAQSRPVLERREGKAWQQVDEHALLDLLNVPNKFYSGERLFGVTLISTIANGAGYWRIERDRKGDPAELWFEPPSGVGPTGIAPAWDEEHFIREYFYFIDGKRHGEPLPRQDVVYFRHGLNPANSREPWAPLSLAAREIATLNSASTYTGALLLNSAVPSGMVTLEGSSLTSGTPPTPEQAEEMKRRIKAGFKGDQVGEPFVSSLPWKWTPFNWSPEQLNISKLQTWPQGMVCALLGTPEIVALLPTGEQPTYQNLAASMEWWWNNTVIPLEDAFADEIETQLFPAFGLDRHEYRLTWDRSQVPALQEDEIAKHQMVREDYRAGVIDLFTATVQLGGEAVEDMRGVYHPSAAPKSEQSEDNPEIKVVDANGMSHGADGKFDGGAGSGSPVVKSWMKEDEPFLTDAIVQRYCEEHNEAHLARELSGRSLPDNEPVDIILHDANGNIIRGIELKTMVRNVRGQIRVRGSARERKRDWEAEHKTGVDLVVFDDRLVYNANGLGKHDVARRRIYYRRGYGNFNVNSMHEVADVAELRRVIHTLENDLPIAAQRRS